MKILSKQMRKIVTMTLLVVMLISIAPATFLASANLFIPPAWAGERIYGVQHMPFRYTAPSGTLISGWGEPFELPEGLVATMEVIYGTPTTAWRGEIPISVPSWTTEWKTLVIADASPELAAILREGTGPDGFADPGFEIFSIARGDARDGFVGVLPYEGAAHRVVSEAAGNEFITHGDLDVFSRLRLYDHTSGKLYDLLEGVHFTVGPALSEGQRVNILEDTFGLGTPGGKQTIVVVNTAEGDAARPTRYSAQSFINNTRLAAPVAPVAPVVRPDGYFLHTVTTSNSLWVLAQHYLGDGRLWPTIYYLNRDVIGRGQFSAIQPGQVLVIPPR